jgi:SAM-dependent methyltransferase
LRPVSDESKGRRVALYRTNKVITAFMKRMGLELYVAPLPKKRAVQGNPTQSALLDGDVNWLRVPMYSAIFEEIAELGRAGLLQGKMAVELGGSEGTLLAALRETGVLTEVAPDYPVIDIEKIPFPDASYDIILLDQVLEHVKHPWRAAQEIHRVLGDGGLCISTSVLVYPVHKGFVGSFGDYFRFSPDGFSSLFEGFKILKSGGWGNAEVMRLVYTHSERGPEGAPPLSKRDAKELGLYDYSDGMNYLMTWCIAQKV